jgi:hypothetical protein
MLMAHHQPATVLGRPPRVARVSSATSLDRRAARRLGREVAISIASLIVFALPLPVLLRFDHSRTFTAVVVGLILCGLSFYSRHGAIAATAVFLAFLGDYRRYAGFFGGYPESDPLLLVGPAVAIVLFCRALIDRRLSLATGISKAVSAFMLLMVLQVFNPAQGGIAVGLAGALFYLVPLLWFWIGRAYASLEFLELFLRRVIVSIGIAATLWGLCQSYLGLFAFEQLWVERIGYGALRISDEVVRAIGFFTSSAEYQRYLIVTAVTVLALWLSSRSRLVLLLPVILGAIVLSAARGPVIMFLGTAVVLWSIAAKSVVAWLPRFAVAATAGLALLIVLLMSLQSASLGERVDLFVARQAEGLLDPANEEKSTARGHLQMITAGIAAGFSSPLGQGLGATTLAADKYGARTTNAEFDFANVMRSLGLLGGAIYAALIASVLLKAIRWWRRERREMALVLIGILVGTLGGWLIGGEYSTVALVWLCVGALDGMTAGQRARRLRRSGDEPRLDHA